MSLRHSSRPQPPSTAKAPERAQDRLSPRALWALAACIGSAVFAIYSPALSFQFILDDHRFTGDPRIQSSGYLWDYFANYVWAQFTGGPPSFYRPLFILWMRVNFILCGLSPWGWHFLSIAKHLVVAALLGLLVWKLLRDRMAALLAATLFALHPAQTESVAWVTVPDPLMSIGVLLSLLLLLRYGAGLQSSVSGPGKKSRRATQDKNAPAASPVLLIASATAFFAALLAKETAIITPLIVFAVLVWADRAQPGLREKAKQQAEKPDSNLGYGLTRAIRQTMPFLIGTGLYLLLRLNALGSLNSRTQDLPFATLIRSWPATLWFYVKVLFWPAHSRAFADPTLVEKFSVQGVLLPTFGVLFVSVALGGVLYWARRKARGDSQRLGVESALIIGTLLLVLPILPALDLRALNPGDFLHGRYTYLPLAGLMLLAATAWHLSGKLRIPLLLLAGVLAAALGTLTVAQEKQWRDDMTVFTVAHELAPRNAPVARNLADAQVQQALQLGEEGRCDEAVPVFQQVNREYPQDWYAWAALGNCQVQLNNYPQAEESFHRAADLSHDPQVIEQWQLLREHMGLPRSGETPK